MKIFTPSASRLRPLRAVDQSILLDNKAALETINRRGILAAR